MKYILAEPLTFPDIKRLGDRGSHVNIVCREPQPCISGNLSGPSAHVNAAMSALEAIHQAAHRIEETAT